MSAGSSAGCRIHSSGGGTSHTMSASHTHSPVPGCTAPSSAWRKRTWVRCRLGGQREAEGSAHAQGEVVSSSTLWAPWRAPSA